MSTVQGPFFVENLGSDWRFVTSESGVRMAEVDGDDAVEKAEQICAALNMVHHLTLSITGTLKHHET